MLLGQNSVVKQFSQAFADVAEKAKPAVVTIITDKLVSMNQFEDFGFFFYPPNQPRQREFKTNALGSGVIIDSKNGYILTNNHVCARGALKFPPRMYAGCIARKNHSGEVTLRCLGSARRATTRRACRISWWAWTCTSSACWPP